MSTALIFCVEYSLNFPFSSAILIGGTGYLYYRSSEAEPLYLRALCIRQQTLGPENPKTISTWEGYARLLRAMQREEDAIAIECDLQRSPDRQKASPSF